MAHATDLEYSFDIVVIFFTNIVDSFLSNYFPNLRNNLNSTLFNLQPLQQFLIEVFDPCFVGVLRRLHGADEEARGMLEF